MSDRAVRVDQYRNKAEELRVIAESMRDAEAKRILLSVADDYLMLAKTLEHARTDGPPTRKRLEFKE